MTDIIGTCVTKDIIQCTFLRDVFGCFADDDGELDLVIWDDVLRWLGDLWDNHWCEGTNESGDGLVE